MTPMHDTREYYSSDVMQDGRVFVAGGEYGSGYDKAEVYDPVATNWTLSRSMMRCNASRQAQGEHSSFADSLSVLLSTGQVLITPVTPVTPGGTVLFDPASNTLLAGAILPYGDEDADEQSAVKLPDDSILTFDSDFGGERYIPSQGQWIQDQSPPVQLFSSSEEIGAGFMLPDGRAFFLGGTGLTLYYTPSGNTNFGRWSRNSIPPDAGKRRNTQATLGGCWKFTNAAAQDPDHHRCAAGFAFRLPGFHRGGADSPGWQDVVYVISDATSMLDLPDGTVLYSDAGGQVYDYKPDTAQLASGTPVIYSVTSQHGCGSLHISGTRSLMASHKEPRSAMITRWTATTHWCASQTAAATLPMVAPITGAALASRLEVES